jgi:outer membrane protein TolC
MVLKYMQESEAAAKETLDLTTKQFELGAVNYLSLLVAQLGYNKSYMIMIEAQAQRYADTAALFQALGGGWWNRDKSTAETTRAEGTEKLNKGHEVQVKEN